MHYTTSCNTQSRAPEDGCDHRAKHVELTGIINKPLLLHLAGVYIIYVNDAGSNKYPIFKPSAVDYYKVPPRESQFLYATETVVQISINLLSTESQPHYA